uniref:Uncharacterized protein n=1 Tax=viral metagenome TaxID=1070528 RepID=A0A6M3L6P6_9ZZZZ
MSDPGPLSKPDDTNESPRQQTGEKDGLNRGITLSANYDEDRHRQEATSEPQASGQ